MLWYDMSYYDTLWYAFHASSHPPSLHSLTLSSVHVYLLTFLFLFLFLFLYSTAPGTMRASLLCITTNCYNSFLSVSHIFSFSFSLSSFSTSTFPSPSTHPSLFHYTTLHYTTLHYTPMYAWCCRYFLGAIVAITLKTTLQLFLCIFFLVESFAYPTPFLNRISGTFVTLPYSTVHHVCVYKEW